MEPGIGVCQTGRRFRDRVLSIPRTVGDVRDHEMSKRLANLVLTIFCTSGVLAAAQDSKAIFEQRIMPIFRSPNPSSCTECHLAGVDLKNYILPSHEKTFLSLRDQGLIDLENPADSKILRLIAMRGGTNQGASLINAKVREAEFSAFSDWIKASSKDPSLRSAPRLETHELAKPTRPNQVIRLVSMACFF
jgi:hypothetical protein